MRDVYMRGDPAVPTEVYIYDYDTTQVIENIEELSILLKAGRDTAVIIRTPNSSETCRLVPKRKLGDNDSSKDEPVIVDECGACWTFRNTALGRECGKCP